MNTLDLPEDADDMQIYGFAELLDQLMAEEELIFTIPAVDEERFRKGLSVAKNRLNKKLVLEGMAPGNRVLDYTTLASEVEGCIDMQVSMKGRQGAKIFNIRKPSTEL
jgi:hypothetical protein